MSATKGYNLSQALLGKGEEYLRRKGSQRGRVERRGDQWHIFYREFSQDENGNVVWRRTSRSVGPATGKDKLSKTAAEQKGYDDWVCKANGLTITPGASATVQQFCDTKFIPDHLDSLRRSTRSSDLSLMRCHVLPSLGHCQLREVSRSMVQTLITSKVKKGLSSQTVIHVKNLISSLFKHAKRLNYFSGELPTEDLLMPEKRHAKRPALTWQQTADLKEHLKEDRLRILVDVMATLGLRIGEAAGLRWSCVNLGEEMQYVDGDPIPPYSIYVREQYSRNEFALLKTNSSEAILPLTSTLWVALAEWFQVSKFTAPGDTVFAGRNGSPLDAHNTARRMLKPAAVKAGIPWASWHNLRHTASTRADQELTLREKMDLLRHKNVGVHMSYTKSDLDRIRQKLELLQAPATKQ